MPADSTEYDTMWSFYGVGRSPPTIGQGPRDRSRPSEAYEKVKNNCGQGRKHPCGGYNFMANKNLGNGIAGVYTTVAGKSIYGGPFADYSFIGGGQTNTVVNDYCTVIGGKINRAIANYATVGGGFKNKASARFATVPGGALNTAMARWSVAMGRRAMAEDDNSLVIGLGSTQCYSKGKNSVHICADAFYVCPPLNPFIDPQRPNDGISGGCVDLSLIRKHVADVSRSRRRLVSFDDEDTENRDRLHDIQSIVSQQQKNIERKRNVLNTLKEELKTLRTAVHIAMADTK